MTKIFRIRKHISLERIRQVTNLLLDGKILIHPTENIYGFGAIISCFNAIKKIIKLKKRKTKKGFIVLISNFSQLKMLSINQSELEMKLIKEFWPGPVTIIFNVNPQFYNKYIVYNKSIAIRMVGNKITRKIIDYINIPIISTSLNISDQKPYTSIDKIRNQFYGKVGGILIHNSENFTNKPSTIVRVNSNKISIIREGIISKKEINKKLDL